MNTGSLDKFATMIVGAAACGLSLAGAPLPPGVAEAAGAGFGMAGDRLAGRNREAGRVLARFRIGLSKNWLKWAQTSSHLTEEARQCAEDAFDHSAPRMIADPGGLVGHPLDAATVAGHLVERAIVIAPKYYAEENRHHRHARTFLRQVTEHAYAHLLAQKWFKEQINAQSIPVILGLAYRIDGTTTRTEEKVDEVRDEIAELKALVLANRDDAVARGELERQVAALKERHAEDGAAVVNLLRLLVDQKLEPEQWGTALADAEARVKDLLANEYRLPNEASERERELIGEARFALERFDFAEAEALRREVRELGRQRRRDQQELMAIEDAAETAEIAQTVAASLDYRRAADLYREAAETPCLPTTQQLRWQLHRASVLGDHGGEYGDNEALKQAIDLYSGTVLPLAPRNEHPDDWAKAQNNFGTALKALGERESGTARLEQAVAAYRAALEEWTRERVPLYWAGIQTNLGSALRTIGERESGTARLEQAVDAYRAALKERTRTRVPLDWAMTQNNLGNALKALGDRESGTERLEQAVAAFRAALAEWTCDRAPLSWAMTQNNLGNALRSIGERESGTARLIEAVTACRAALQERTRERVPVDWAKTQGNLCVIEIGFFDKTREVAHLDLAEVHCRAALEVFGEAGASHYVGMAEGLLREITQRRDGEV